MSIHLELRYNGNTGMLTDTMGSRRQIEVVAINSDPEWLKKKKKPLSITGEYEFTGIEEGNAFLLREAEDPRARMKGENRHKFNTENYSTLPAVLD